MGHGRSNKTILPIIAIKQDLKRIEHLKKGQFQVPNIKFIVESKASTMYDVLNCVTGLID